MAEKLLTTSYYLMAHDTSLPRVILTSLSLTRAYTSHIVKLGMWKKDVRETEREKGITLVSYD